MMRDIRGQLKTDWKAALHRGKLRLGGGREMQRSPEGLPGEFVIWLRLYFQLTLLPVVVSALVSAPRRSNTDVLRGPGRRQDGGPPTPSALLHEGALAAGVPPALLATTDHEPHALSCEFTLQGGKSTSLKDVLIKSSFTFIRERAQREASHLLVHAQTPPTARTQELEAKGKTIRELELVTLVGGSEHPLLLLSAHTFRKLGQKWNWGEPSPPTLDRVSPAAL